MCYLQIKIFICICEKKLLYLYCGEIVYSKKGTQTSTLRCSQEGIIKNYLRKKFICIIKKKYGNFSVTIYNHIKVY